MSKNKRLILIVGLVALLVIGSVTALVISNKNKTQVVDEKVIENEINSEGHENDDAENEKIDEEVVTVVDKPKVKEKIIDEGTEDDLIKETNLEKDNEDTNKTETDKTEKPKKEKHKKEKPKVDNSKSEVDSKAKADANKKAKAEADKKAKADADKQAKAKKEADRKRKVAADKKAKEEASKKPVGKYDQVKIKNIALNSDFVVSSEHESVGHRSIMLDHKDNNENQRFVLGFMEEGRTASINVFSSESILHAFSKMTVAAGAPLTDKQIFDTIQGMIKNENFDKTEGGVRFHYGANLLILSW